MLSGQTDTLVTLAAHARRGSPAAKKEITRRSISLLYQPCPLRCFFLGVGSLSLVSSHSLPCLSDRR